MQWATSPLLMVRNPSHRRGNTLVEVLFAFFLLAIGAASYMATMPMANTSRARAAYQNLAMSLAQKQIEASVGVGYANSSAHRLFSAGFIDSTDPIATNTYPSPAATTLRSTAPLAFSRAAPRQ